MAAVPLHSARFHLDKLVDAGLLEVSYARISGRSGPGAGRPAKLYRRSAVEVTVSLPRRSYDLVGSVLASALERTLAGDEVAESLRDEAHTRGRTIGAAYDGSGDDLHRASGVLAEEGFEPHREGDDVCLRNCPFDALVAQHTALVCGVNLDLVTGVLDGLAVRVRARPRLQPATDHCCVRVRGLSCGPFGPVPEGCTGSAGPPGGRRPSHSLSHPSHYDSATHEWNLDALPGPVGGRRPLRRLGGREQGDPRPVPPRHNKFGRRPRAREPDRRRCPASSRDGTQVQSGE